jgi:hypothetical protein
MRRIASKFGDAPEPLAALTAIAYGRGDTTEAERAWSQVPLTERDKYLDGAYLKTQLKWPPAVCVLFSMCCYRVLLCNMLTASDCESGGVNVVLLVLLAVSLSLAACVCFRACKAYNTAVSKCL